MAALATSIDLKPPRTFCYRKINTNGRIRENILFSSSILISECAKGVRAMRVCISWCCSRVRDLNLEAWRLGMISQSGWVFHLVLCIQVKQKADSEIGMNDEKPMCFPIPLFLMKFCITNGPGMFKIDRCCQSGYLGLCTFLRKMFSRLAGMFVFLIS